jgi:uncharacterized coiled-coil protein SlyX
MKKRRNPSGLCLGQLLVLFVFALNATMALAGVSPKKSDNAAPAAATGNDVDSPEDGSASSENVKALQMKVEEQQAQIEKLTRAVDLLTRRLNDTSAKAPAAPVQPAPTAQVSSLAPVIPASVSSAPASLGVPADAGAKPAAQEKLPKLSDLAYGKIKIGATFFGDYSVYTNTGFGPQFITQTNPPGPGNVGFNSFDVTRTYINIFYTPNDAVTLRFTPNIFRQVAPSTGAQSDGKGAAFGSSANGNLSFRLKYAYVDLNSVFSEGSAFHGGKVTVGQTTNPLVDWQEALYGYRFVNLVPWNYLSLSSTYVGAKVHGPISFNGKEYLDYDIGAFNTASFHSIEQSDKKQFMGRMTWYPFGTKKDRTGFGVTVFDDYGYNGKTPDTRSTALYRFSALAHYQSPKGGYQIAGELDLGRNAFGLGNLYSGVGPGDAFGLGPTPYATWNSLAAAILSGDHTRQRGYDVFGHAQIWHSPFKLFGMYQFFQPNTNIKPNPLDFARTVVGISYKFNEHFELALDNQNLNYTKSQFLMPASQIQTFSTSLAAANPNGIPNPVPQSTNAVFLNMMFNY